MSRPLIYLAGPYRAESESAVFGNICRAREAAMGMWRVGFVPVCPHLNSALMGGVVADGIFLTGDLEILARCDAVALLLGWNESAGALARRDFAVAERIPLLVWELVRREGRMRMVDAKTGMEVRPGDVAIRWKGAQT